VTRFSQDQIDQARKAVAMSKLVGKHVKLRKTGNEYSACCPVHKENGPSFTVNDHKGFAHCFGCGFHADPIKWLTDYENYSFHDAVTYLLGGDAKPGQQRIEERQSIRQDDEPECVDSFVVAEHIIGLTQPISGTIVEAYLRSRGIEPDLLRGYLDNLAFVPNCPLYSWRIDQGPRDVKTAPAMVAPIHAAENLSVSTETARNWLRARCTASIKAGPLCSLECRIPTPLLLRVKAWNQRLVGGFSRFVKHRSSGLPQRSA
jgi:CHC2 zinc finger